MATQRVLPQSKESLLQNYNKRLKDDIRSILDNFTEIVKTAKVYLYTFISFLLSVFVPLSLSLLLSMGCVCLLFSMKDILVSGSLTSCHVLSRDILSLCSKYLSKCALFSVHCFLSPDRGWDTGVPSNPGRAGPLWDARQSSQHCEYKLSFPE